MSERKPKITEDVQRLIDMDCEMIFAKDIAPVIHMNPDVIIKYAKDGIWDQDHLGKFVISGDRVKFFRKDFLQKCGFVRPDPPETTEKDVMIAVIDGLKAVLEGQKQLILLLEEQNAMLRRRQE